MGMYGFIILILSLRLFTRFTDSQQNQAVINDRCNIAVLSVERSKEHFVKRHAVNEQGSKQLQKHAVSTTTLSLKISELVSVCRERAPVKQGMEL